MPGTQEVPATGSPEDSCSWPQAGVPHAVTWPAKVTHIVQAALELEGMQLAPPTLVLPRCTSFSNISRVTPAGGNSSHMGPNQQMNTHTDVCAHPAAVSSPAQRSPLDLVTLGALVQPPPLAACLPAATFAQLCLVFSCLPSFGGEVVCGAVSTACTWASARGEPAKQPPHQPAHTPTGQQAGREGLGPGCPNPWEGPALGSQTGHTPSKA